MAASPAWLNRSPSHPEHPPTKYVRLTMVWNGARAGTGKRPAGSTRPKSRSAHEAGARVPLAAVHEMAPAGLRTSPQATRVTSAPAQR